MKKEDLLQDIPRGGYTLPSDWIMQYIKGGYSKTGGERRGSAYEPLFQIFKSLEVQLEERVAKHGASNGFSLVNMKDREVKGHSARLKPDFLMACAKKNQALVWKTADPGESGELKKSQKKTKKRFQRRVQIDINNILSVRLLFPFRSVR